MQKRAYLFLIVVCCLFGPVYGKSNGFKEVKKEKCATDILHTYRHTATGLDVIWIENEDENKTFILGVKTPTKDSTGVNHIIEHTLFTGSRDYPSASLFFDANEAYPNTYMNALTTGDMTIFPFSTPYDSCYKELLHVYLDAIFEPNFLHQPYGFYEEGFHFSPQEKRGAGVVYNEMKGAYSSTERVIFRTIRNTIFKGSHYAYDSGGAPNEIPTLTYKDFVETYRAFYYPANMKVILYGKLPIEESLEQIARYLVTRQGPKAGIELDVKALNEETTTVYYGLPNTQKGCLVKSFVINEKKTAKELQAIDLWMSTYLMNSQFGLKRELDACGLGQARWIKDADIPYPIYSLVISELPYDKLEQYSKRVDKLLDNMPDKIAANAFAEQDILSEANWIMLKRDTSSNRGIEIGENILDGWAHNRELDQYYTKLDYIQNTKSLDQGVSDQIFKSAKRYTTYLLPANYEVDEPEGLSPLSTDEWQAIQPKLEAWQKQKVKLEPIELEKLIKAPSVSLETKAHNDYKEMITRVPGDWARSQLYFGTGHIEQKDLPYLFLYAHLLEESAKEITPFSGMISAKCTAYNKADGYWPCMKLTVLTKANETEHGVLLEQARRILENKPDIWYKQKLFEWALEMKSASQNNVLSTLADLSLGAEDGMKRYLYEQSYPNYEFCKNLLSMNHCGWRGRIKTIDKELYHKGDLVLATTVPKLINNPYAKSWETFIEALPCFETSKCQYVFDAHPKLSILQGQGVIDHCYMSMDKDKGVDGLDYLATTYLSKNYLYPKIRVGLGAYGAGCQISYPCTIAFYTYRDPNYHRSLKVLEGVCDFLNKPIDPKALVCSKAEALSKLHMQFHLLDAPLECANVLETLAIMDKDAGYLMTLQEQILKATPEAIQVKGDIYRSLLKRANLAIMTPKNDSLGQKFMSYHY